MILLDTTVLAYAVGTEHPLRDPCRRLLAWHGEGRIEATTTVDVIQEFTDIRARRRTRADAVALARRYLDALDPIVTMAGDLELALDLFVGHQQLGAFDAVLAAVAIQHQVQALVSADRAFASVPGLDWVDPGVRNLRHRVGA